MLYDDGGTLTLAADDDDTPTFDSSVFDDVADLIYRAGGFDINQIKDPKVRKLILATVAAINRGVDAHLPTDVPDTLRYALEENTFVFSGFKTFHAMREIGLSLVNDKGEIKPYAEFQEDVLKLNNRYNRNYLYAEYKHAVGTSQMAAKWAAMEQDGDRYLLQYRTAEDNRVREDHAAMNGITLPPSDPFWDKYYPPNGWGCRCTAVQVRRGKYAESDPAHAMLLGDNSTEAAKQQMFRFNPGKQMKLFPPKHPYYKAPEAVKQVVNDMATEHEFEYIRRRVKEIREYMADHLSDPLVNEGLSATAYMSNRSVKEFTNQPHKHIRAKNELLMNIRKVYKAARYLGINPTYIKPGIVASHILEIELCGEKSWLVVREYDDGSLNLYSCSDNPRIAIGLIKK
jgi:SPP1 gp7 family putative phage head morphogenesis protein